MMRICSNPECQKEYEVKDEKHDDGYCCFDCWEKVNCKEPQLIFEDFTVS
jgi:hypothetical protein